MCASVQHFYIRVFRINRQFGNVVISAIPVEKLDMIIFCVWHLLVFNETLIISRRYELWVRTAVLPNLWMLMIQDKNKYLANMSFCVPSWKLIIDTNRIANLMGIFLMYKMVFNCFRCYLYKVNHRDDGMEKYSMTHLTPLWWNDVVLVICLRL